MLVLSANAEPRDVLPEHFGPIMKNILGIIALFVLSYTSSTDPKASIQWTLPNFLYNSTTGLLYSLNALNLLISVSGLSSALPDVYALARHLSISISSLTL